MLYNSHDIRKIIIIKVISRILYKINIGGEKALIKNKIKGNEHNLQILNFRYGSFPFYFITYWTAKPQAASHTGGSFGAYEIIFVTLQYDSVFQFIIT